MNGNSETPGWLSAGAAASIWGVIGAGFLIWGVAIRWLSTGFVYGSDMGSRPILPLVALLAGGGLLSILLLPLARRTAPTWQLAWWVFFAGAMMRLIMATSQPILEDDWYRYLWDGGVSAHGMNPYAIVPGDAVESESSDPIHPLAREAGIVLERVNHPELGTIYPPVAQAFFAVAHWISPWEMSGLRVVYFAVDCLVFGLLVVLLADFGRSPLYAALYWWNPLLLKECYNSLHMDLLLVPFLLGTLVCARRSRAIAASALLAGAVAVKLWPILLLPSLVATQWRTPKRALCLLLVFTGLSLALLAPMGIVFQFGGSSGLIAYGRGWEMNDALFMVFPWLIQQGASLAGVGLLGGAVHRMARLVVALMVAALSVWAAVAMIRSDRRRDPRSEVGGNHASGELLSWWLWIVAALFLLSPTQFPWYFLWILPLLVLNPRLSLLALAALLPLYYVKFFLDARGQIDFFHYRVVWIEYIPVWLLLFWEFRRERANRDGKAGRA